MLISFPILVVAPAKAVICLLLRAAIVPVVEGLFNVIGIWVCYAIAIADK
ncbi:hypothetical protein [uncultured Shewanella sp.]|nr:hypothetical protein [uncultured Shewanella sp.]